jgi:hypothetical protein
MIFFFLVKAMTRSFARGLGYLGPTSIDFAQKRADLETLMIRVTLTSKNRKQFQLTGGKAVGSRQVSGFFPLLFACPCSQSGALATARGCGPPFLPTAPEW